LSNRICSRQHFKVVLSTATLGLVIEQHKNAKLECQFAKFKFDSFEFKQQSVEMRLQLVVVEAIHRVEEKYGQLVSVMFHKQESAQRVVGD